MIIWDVLLKIEYALPWDLGWNLFKVGPSLINTSDKYNLSTFIPLLLIAFAMADCNNFNNKRVAFLLEFFKIDRASFDVLYLIKSAN